MHRALGPPARAGWSEEGFDPERRALTGTYRRALRRAGFWRAAYGLACLAVLLWLFFRSSRPPGVGPVTMGLWAVAAYLAYAAGLAAVTFVTAYRAGRRVGLLTRSPAGWWRDTALRMALQAALLWAGVTGLWWLLLSRPGDWWLWAALAGIALELLAAWLAPVVIMPLFTPQRPLADATIFTRLAGLAARSGVRVTGVYVLEMSRQTSGANAMLAGLGRTRRILLGDNLFRHFPREEIEVILAHELGHHVHHHLARGLFQAALAGLAVSYFAFRFLNLAAAQWGLAPADPARLLLVALAVATANWLLAPLLAWLSRRREWQADGFALAATGDWRVFASAMARLGDLNLLPAQPGRWGQWRASHPSLRSRIDRARSADD